MPLTRPVRVAASLGAAVALVACAQTPGSGPPASAAAPERQVLVISVDGLNPDAITKLGRDGTPALHRMMRQGASTLNARTELEQTETLPNHTGMVTGRRIDAAHDGHGVTWNDERLHPTTVQQAAGEGVDSIFSAAERSGLDGALYAAKEKFTLFDRSWPAGVDKEVVRADNAANVETARRDLRRGRFAFAFLHISLPDAAGHAHGWMSKKYLRSVRRSDRLVGTVLSTIATSKAVKARTTVILTADHGGVPGDKVHAKADRPANYRIPFLMWGSGVARGADLYDLSPALADPGDARVGYSGAQPVRNGFVANAAAELLGIPAVRESELNAAGQLRWTDS